MALGPDNVTSAGQPQLQEVCPWQTGHCRLMSYECVMNENCVPSGPCGRLTQRLHIVTYPHTHTLAMTSSQVEYTSHPLALAM